MTSHELSSYQVVQNMGQGMSPKDAITAVLKKISKFYPTYSGAMVAATTSGEYGAAYVGFSYFPYTVFNTDLGQSTVLNA